MSLCVPNVSRVSRGWITYDEMDRIFEESLPANIGSKLEVIRIISLYFIEPRWHVAPDMNTEREEHGVAICDGILYAVGGKDEDWGALDSVEYLDLRQMEQGWRNAPKMNEHRNCHVVACSNGKVFAIGGKGTDWTVTASVEYLDVAHVEQGWKKAPSMNSKRKCHGVAVWDGKLFVVGGYRRSTVEYLKSRK